MLGIALRQLMCCALDDFEALNVVRDSPSRSSSKSKSITSSGISDPYHLKLVLILINYIDCWADLGNLPGVSRSFRIQQQSSSVFSKVYFLFDAVAMPARKSSRLSLALLSDMAVLN